MKPSIPLHQCALYKCKSKKRLSKILKLEPCDLASMAEWVVYRKRLEPKSKEGEFRTIYAPGKKLKRTQSRIKALLERVEKPEWVFSGAKGRCHVDNGEYNAGSKHFVLADIASFYTGCTRDAVYRFFLDDLRTSPDVASVLADLTTVNDGGKCFIPTGSPASQLVAYFSYRNMFDELKRHADRYGCRFSLYVDDLTISSRSPISDPHSLVELMAKTMRAYGHRLKREKVKYRGARDNKVVTGVAIDQSGETRVPNKLGRGVIQGMEHMLLGQLDEQQVVMGRIGAARQIKLGVFPEVERIVDDCVRG